MRKKDFETKWWFKCGYKHEDMDGIHETRIRNLTVVIDL
jgi:hypothetical protein